MPLLKFIEKKRAAPVAERQRLAIVGALILTIGVIVLWLGWVAWRELLLSPGVTIEGPGPLSLFFERLGRGWEKIYGWFRK